MKNFKTFIQEQKQSEGETTLSPDFLEKKQRRDDRVEAKIDKPMKEITKKAERMDEKEVVEE
jgi:hypothetical protein